MSLIRVKTSFENCILFQNYNHAFGDIYDHDDNDGNDHNDDDNYDDDDDHADGADHAFNDGVDEMTGEGGGCLPLSATDHRRFGLEALGFIQIFLGVRTNIFCVQRNISFTTKH